MNNPIIISGVITAIATIVAAVILSRIRKIKRSKTKILESTKFIINSVKELEKQLMASRWIPDVIVASGRGGAVVAGIAADLFGRRPLKVVDIHYVTRHGNREIIIDTSSLNEEHLKHKRILLVEFTRYSGDTANKIISVLENSSMSECRTFALYVMSSTKQFPDYFAKKIDKAPISFWRQQDEDDSEV